MIYDSHPYRHMIGLLKRLGDVELEFSSYQYKPQTVFDQRTFLNVSVADFSADWMTNTLSKLREGEELAFHSKIVKSKRTLHIPMIDFSCTVDELDLAKATLRKILPSHIFSGLVYYDSGRSLHAYGSCHLQKNKWVEFMGSLLLANLPDKPQIVDSRWVGHRLLGGFSSLRWSSNSGNYLRIPSEIRQ
jgi:hypothetical protein